MLRRIMELYRTGQIRSIEPLKVFDISEAAQAFRHFSSSNRIGKVTLSFENDRSQVKVRNNLFFFTFLSTYSFTDPIFAILFVAESK